MHGAPWSARFGMNRDAALLERLRPQYAHAIDQALIAPARQHWARQLQALNQAPSAELAADPARTEQGYQTLKAYLTLDQPARAEPAFLAAQLTAQASAAHADFSPALLRAMAQFYAERLAGQPGWRIAADPALAQASRQTLIGQLGRQQADDARYQPILAEAAAKYPPQTLAALLPGQDLRGLWRSEASLPGVFTRKAWDEHLRAAFADAHRRQGNAGDWVLGAGEAGQPSADATQDAALRQRYFADYARAWQRFLNDVSWQVETKLAANAQQLQVYADPQRSPLRALMALVRDNARAGERVDSLGANLVDKAQALLGKADASAPARAAAEAAPLAQSFGPLLRLLEERQDGSALSLQRYLERVAATRLKLQQVAAAPDRTPPPARWRRRCSRARAASWPRAAITPLNWPPAWARTGRVWASTCSCSPWTSPGPPCCNRRPPASTSYGTRASSGPGNPASPAAIPSTAAMLTPRCRSWAAFYTPATAWCRSSCASNWAGAGTTGRSMVAGPGGGAGAALRPELPQ